MAASSLRTLGGFAFSVNGSTTQSPATRKARALMSYLVLSQRTDCARERLLEIFWPDADPDRARDSLSTALYSIRRCLRSIGAHADAFFLANKSVVRWTADTSVDALHFTELAGRDDPASAQEALELYRGDFLEGDYDEWALSERERLASLYETVLARLVHSSKDVETAHRFIARNPYDEDAYAVIIDAEIAAGRRSSALSWLERCRQALAEVNEKPSAEFEARFGCVATTEDAVAAEEVSLPFTGREMEINFLGARFAEAARRCGSLTLVYGVAGIGKSTLLNRACQVATPYALPVLKVRCGNESATTFGPWKDLFTTLGAGDFDTFVKAHASDLATAVADTIFSHLTRSTALIIDDAHEPTGEALDILIAVLRKGATEHAVVAGLRPEGLSILRSRVADVALEELAIDALDRDHLQWALAFALGNDEPGLLDVLYDRTAGHPLFFAGLLNSLVNEGILVRDGRRWQLTRSIGPDIELPENVRRFIETRLRERGEGARAVACALALEPTANSDDIAASLTFDEATTLDALDDLLSLGVIVEPSTGPQFAFSHELIREIAAGELNAGRLALLHRRFAARLEASAQADSALRVARHLQGAGEAMGAARAYLKSAHEALELNAAQDAIGRCDEGVRETAKLERTPERDALLAALYRTAGRAAIAGGNADAAIKRARESAVMARSANDLCESARAALDLAVMDGAALELQAHQVDADLAIQNARMCGDAALEAQALIQRAIAARHLGERDDALAHAQSSYDVALRCSVSTIIPAALEELLRVQMSWWLFDDAFKTLRAANDAARFEEPFVEAAFLYSRAQFWYLMNRLPEAQSDVHAALRIANETSPRSSDELVAAVHPQPYLQFACRYTAGKIDVSLARFDDAIEECNKAATLANVVKLPLYGEALTLLRIDALLQRGTPSDNESATDLADTLPEATRAQGMFGWSDCIQLARGRVAARSRIADAGLQLRSTLDVLEEHAHRALLDADVAFARLSGAATEIGAVAVAQRARARSHAYNAKRLAAASAARLHELR